MSKKVTIYSRYSFFKNLLDRVFSFSIQLSTLTTTSRHKFMNACAKHKNGSVGFKNVLYLLLFVFTHLYALVESGR